MRKKLRYWIKQGDRKKELMILILSTLGLTIAFIICGLKSDSVFSSILHYTLLILVLANAMIFRRSIRQVIRSQGVNKELSKQKHFFHTALNSISQGLITTDKKGGIIYMNAIAERLTGWKMRDAKDQPLSKVYNVVNEETGLPIHNIVNRIITTRRSVALESNILLKTKDGDKVVISNYGSPLFEANGSISGTLMVFADITHKRIIESKLTERENQYRVLIQNLPVAVYTCDEFGYIQLYNKAAAELWGREPIPGNEQWCGSWKIFSPDGNELSKDATAMAITLKNGKPIHGDPGIIQRSDESLRHVLFYPTPLFDDNGKLTGAVNMLVDITDKKEKEPMIKKIKEINGTVVSVIEMKEKNGR